MMLALVSKQLEVIFHLSNLNRFSNIRGRWNGTTFFAPGFWIYVFLKILSKKLDIFSGSEAEKLHVGRQLNEEHHHDHEEGKFEGLDRLMGMSLVLGFIFMMFVEQLAAYMSSSGQTRVVTTDAESLVQSSGKFWLD